MGGIGKAGDPAFMEEVMRVTDLISANDVILDLGAESKRSLLQALSAEAADRIGRPQQEILDALQAREQLGSTALGRGVALPHARLSGDTSPIVLFARLSRPIDFEARDDERVDLVITVLWPEAAPDGFLPALAEICRVLREPQVLRRLRLAASREDVIALLQQDGSPPSTPDAD